MRDKPTVSAVFVGDDAIHEWAFRGINDESTLACLEILEMDVAHLFLFFDGAELREEKSRGEGGQLLGPRGRGWCWAQADMSTATATIK